MLYRGQMIQMNRNPLGDGQRRFFEGSDGFADRLALRLCIAITSQRKSFLSRCIFRGLRNVGSSGSTKKGRGWLWISRVVTV